MWREEPKNTYAELIDTDNSVEMAWGKGGKGARQWAKEEKMGTTVVV